MQTNMSSSNFHDHHHHHHHHLSSSDSIQIRIDECGDVTSSPHDVSQEVEGKEEQPTIPYSTHQIPFKLRQQVRYQQSASSPDGGSDCGRLLGVRDGCKRERRNSWCSTTPSEALANLKRRWFATVSNNANGNVTGDDADDDVDDVIGVERKEGKCKSFSLTSLDCEDDFLFENDKRPLSPTRPLAIIHRTHDHRHPFDHQSASTLSPSSASFHHHDLLNDHHLLGHCRNARSEQDVRGGVGSGEDKIDGDLPDSSAFRTERFSLETDSIFAIKSPFSKSSPVAGESREKLAGSRLTGASSRSSSPTTEKSSLQSDHPNLDLLVARHKSEGNLQRFPIKEPKSSAQRKSSVLSKFNSYRNSRKQQNSKVAATDSHNFITISPTSPILIPSASCDSCNKPFLPKKAVLKCLDCGVITHQESSCKDHLPSCQPSAEDQKTSNPNIKSEDVYDGIKKQLNKGNSSTTTTNTTESDSFELADFSFEDNDPVFSTVTTGPQALQTNGTVVPATGLIPKEEEEAWSLTVDQSVLDSMTKNEIKRQNLIWELVRNEKHHYRILMMISKVFVAGLRHEVGLEPSVINQLFPGLEGLIAVHGNIRKALLQQQNIRPDKRIDDLAYVLLEQFCGPNGQQMESLYGDFCSQHEKAVNLYKELKRSDRKFQNFINKCVNIVACERRGIDSCILTVTQRLTKYPLLVEQILKYTDDETESRDLSEFLQLVRSIISSVNDRVDYEARKERFEAIFDKLDPKSVTTLGSRTIRKSDILNMEKFLRYEKPIKLKTARGRTIEATMLVLTEWIVFLTENNHKYFFSNIDNKSSMIPLSKLLVREKDDKHDGRHFFLITSHKDSPAEMYEVICRSNSDFKVLTSEIRQASALSASKAETHPHILAIMSSDHAQLKSLIENLQSRDEEVKTALTLKMTTIEEFYKTFDKLPSRTTALTNDLKSMTNFKSSQPLSLEELVKLIHVQETGLIASLQSNSLKVKKRRSLSRERDSSSVESLTSSRRPSSASLSTKVHHSSSFRNITDSTTVDSSINRQNSSDCGETDSVEGVKIKRKVSDASVTESRLNYKASSGMLPAFLSIFYKEKDEISSIDVVDDSSKHKKHSSLSLQQQQSFQQHSNASVQQLQHNSQQFNSLQHQNTKQFNKFLSQDHMQPMLSQESEDLLCSFLNNIHTLSVMALDLSSEARKREMQIYWLTKELEKAEKSFSYPTDRHLEELRSLQNQVQSEKLQLQEVKLKHQEDVDKFEQDVKVQTSAIEKQKAEMKTQKDELQRQKDTLQRQIDLFEEQKSNFNARMQSMMNQLGDPKDIPQLNISSGDPKSNLSSIQSSFLNHERTHSHPLVLPNKQFSTILGTANRQNRSGSPSPALVSSLPINNILNSSSTLSKPQQSKHARSGLTSELFEPPETPSIDEKNGVLVKKKDAVPLLPVHLVSATNETRLGHSISLVDDGPQSHPLKQMLPSKLATISAAGSKVVQRQQQQQQQQQQINPKNCNTEIQSSKVEGREEGDSKGPLSATIYGSKSGNSLCNMLPMHLAEKSKVISSHHNHQQQIVNNKTATFPSSSSNNSTVTYNNILTNRTAATTCRTLPVESSASVGTKPNKSFFSSGKKFLSPTSPSVSPLATSSSLQAMMSMSSLAPKVQFLSFPNNSNSLNQLATSPAFSSPSAMTLTHSFPSSLEMSPTSSVAPVTGQKNQQRSMDKDNSKSSKESSEADEEVIYL